MPVRQVIFPAVWRGYCKILSPLFFNKPLIMMSRKISFVVTALVLMMFLFPSCDFISQPVSKNTSTDEIIKADEAFSDMSRQVGMKKAFLQYIDNEGVLLRPDHQPIMGADAIDFLSLVNDSAYSLSWKPSGSKIANSGELGYTYGIYELKTKDTTLSGTYISIWKKESDGSWKYVLNSGNEGITPAN